MRDTIIGYTQLRSIRITCCLIISPVWIGYGRSRRVDRLTFSISISCHYIQTEVKWFFQFKRHIIGIAFTCIVQQHYVSVSGILLFKHRSVIKRKRRISRTDSSITIHLIIQIAIIYIIQRLWIKTFQCHLYIARKHIFESQISTKVLGEFKVFRKDIHLCCRCRCIL